MSNYKTDTLRVYSQNVSCDIHSKKLIDFDDMGEKYRFENRITYLMKGIPENLDIVAFNEIRLESNVKQVSELLATKGFQVETFKNNDDEKSFNNVLAISKQSKWTRVNSKHLWVALNKDDAQGNNKPHLDDKLTYVEGDPHGRCAGVVYLKHEEGNQQVCVMVSHVLPFGEVKFNQQDALFTLNNINLSKDVPIPTIIVGDLNRFTEEDEDFQARLKSSGLVEAKPTKLIIPKSNGDIVKTIDEDVGTFTPWPTDAEIYDSKLSKPMSDSRLDVQLYTFDHCMITCENLITRASMLLEPNSDPPPEGRNPTRHLLNKRMASDHIALIGTYTIPRSSTSKSAQFIGQVKKLFQFPS